MSSLTARPAVAVACLLVVVTGCAGQTDTPAAAPSTSPTQTATESPTPTPTPTPTPEQAAYSLSQGQIAAALITADDLAPGFAADETALLETSADGETVDPAACTQFIASLDVNAPDNGAPIAQGQAGFSSGTTILAENIESYASAFDDTWLSSLAATAATCATFVHVDTDGSKGRGTVSAIDVPNDGERSAAYRIAVTYGPGQTVTLDVVMVTIGQVLVVVGAGGLAPVDPTALHDLVAGALAKLPAAA